MNTRREVSVPNRCEIQLPDNKELQKKSNFMIDSMASVGNTDQRLKNAVFKKSFDSIEELRDRLELNGFQMAAMPLRLMGSGSNFAQVDVFRSGIYVARLGIKARASLEGPIVCHDLDAGDIRLQLGVKELSEQTD